LLTAYLTILSSSVCWTGANEISALILGEACIFSTK
jgi:hypothetical protein